MKKNTNIKKKHKWIKLGVRQYIRNKAQVTEATSLMQTEEHWLPVFVPYVRNIYISIPSKYLVIYHRQLNEQLRFVFVRATARACARVSAHMQSLKAWRQSTNGLSRIALKPFQLPDTGVTKYSITILLFITFAAVWVWLPWYWGPAWQLSMQKLWFRRVQRSFRRQILFSAILSIIDPHKV